MRKKLFLMATVPLVIIGVLAVGALVFLSGTAGLRIYGVFALLGMAVSCAISVWAGSKILGSITNLGNAVERLVEAQRELSLTGADAALKEWGPIDLDDDATLEPITTGLNTIKDNSLNLQDTQQQAVKKGIANIVINMARRSQTLLDRQVELIDALESTEEDPDRLEELFKIDHLATRMRRNAESLLVLAEADPGRRRGGPVDIGDVLRVAMGEIENYLHISLGSIHDGKISAGSAVDVAHMTAELMENATQFSPPESPVEVSAHFAKSGDYLIDIVDHGMGMNEEQLAKANQTLSQPPELGLEMSRSLGFIVIGRLAARIGASVEISSTEDSGTKARLKLPASMFVKKGSKKTSKKKRSKAKTDESPSSFAAAPQAEAPAPVADAPPSAKSDALSKLLGLDMKNFAKDGAEDKPEDWAAQSPFASAEKASDLAAEAWKPPEVTPDAPIPTVPGLDEVGSGNSAKTPNKAADPVAAEAPSAEKPASDKSRRKRKSKKQRADGDRAPTYTAPPTIPSFSAGDDQGFLKEVGPESGEDWTPPAVVAGGEELVKKAPDKLEEAIPTGGAFDAGVASLLDDGEPTDAEAGMAEVAARPATAEVDSPASVPPPVEASGRSAGGLTKRQRGSSKSPLGEGRKISEDRTTAKASSRDPEEIRSMLSRYRQGLKGDASVTTGTEQDDLAAVEEDSE